MKFDFLYRLTIYYIPNPFMKNGIAYSFCSHTIYVKISIRPSFIVVIIIKILNNKFLSWLGIRYVLDHFLF